MDHGGIFDPAIEELIKFDLVTGSAFGFPIITVETRKTINAPFFLLLLNCKINMCAI